MQNFTLYHDPESIEIELCTNTHLHHIKKVRSIQDQAFLLNTRNELFTGLVNANACYVELKLLTTAVIDFDIDCKDKRLYIVDDKGCVHRSTLPFEKNEPVEITVPSPKSCVHGFKRPKLKISKVCVNEDGILFVTMQHELFAMGNFEDVVCSNYPVPVECFAGFKILQVVAGSNFVVVLTYKKPHIGFDDISDEESDTSNYFNSNCYLCSPDAKQNEMFYEESITPSTAAESSNGKNSSEQLEQISSEIKNLAIDVVPTSGVLDQRCDESNNDVNSLNECSMMSSTLEDVGSVEDLMEGDIEADIIKICRVGANMLGTGVWCFGSVNKGHLGTGDHIKRTRINQVLGLTGQGVVKVCCGNEHSVAITLDGRLFLWGNNNQQQISTEEIEDVSSPRRYRNAQNVLDVACGSYSTIILHNDLQIKEIRKELSDISPQKKSFKSLENDESKCKESTSFILASNNLMIQNHSTLAPIEKHLNSEQKFLQDMLQTYQSILKPFRKKLYFTNKNPTIDHLCQQYLNILNMTAVNLKSMVDFYNETIGYTDVLFLISSTEMTASYRAYTTCFCDVVVMHGFLNENLALGKVKDTRKIFMALFQRVWCYVDFICHLLEINSLNNAFLEEKRSVWEKYKIEKDLAIELADKTAKFWETSGKPLAAKLQSSERRLILDSKELSLKLMASNRFSSHWFILFSDVFCHYTGSNLQLYPLNTLWISPLLDIENRKNSFKLTSPEDTMILLAQDLEAKTKWMEAIELGCKSCLELSASSAVPKFRNATYTFSEKHSKYPRARYVGQWWCGQMQGIGHFEFPDGRMYTGQLSNNEISGIGKMFSPTGVYEGEFLNGKYHGHGVLEVKNKETYEGNFKDGVYQGHGVLRTNQFTYIGEFSNNSKNGYGVLDDAITGDKYMGMFVDNKKCGPGILITMDGNYFEGTFVNDSLANFGIAFLPNGSYFEGELTLNGPNGKGTLCLPTSDVKIETIELEDRKIEMIGTISSGTF
ncbi:Alsin like, partial [Pseudolycoriella hygida]